MTPENVGSNTQTSVMAAGKAVDVERFKTLSRQDPQFTAYLDGTFSSTHRALPVRSMNVATVREEITFELKPVTEIHGPGPGRLIWALMRPASLSFSLGPMLVTWLYAWSQGITFDTRLVVSTLISVLLFHAGLNVLDDYFDHRGGRDRLNPRGGSRAIQNGWVRARSLLHAGAGLMALAILTGLPVVLESPGLILALAVVALIGGLGFTSDRIRLKSRGWGEITTFFLAGPLLTSGFMWATTGAFGWDSTILGCIFGFTAVTYYHLKNIENIMLDSQSQTRTLAARLGFDSAKKMVWTLMGLSAAAILLFVWASRGAGLFAFALFPHVFVLFPIVRRLEGAPSPLSSELRELRRQGLRAHVATLSATALAIAASLFVDMGS
ncbi:MAG: prenyltransferase [Bdellovibrionaceae bacterium]|nr:prenyltransferase [Pseudobdellovibrionaceae bacterium]